LLNTTQRYIGFDWDLTDRSHQEIGGLLISPCKRLKFVLKSQEGYEGLVFVVTGYEPTSLTKYLRNPITVIIDCKISRVREPHIGLWSIVSPREIC
jgi:hypothetical protein